FRSAQRGGWKAAARAVPHCYFSRLIRRADATHAARSVGVYDRRWHQRLAAMGLEGISRVARRNLHDGYTLRYAVVEARHILGRRFARYDVCRHKSGCLVRHGAFVRRLHHEYSSEGPEERAGVDRVSI